MNDLDRWAREFGYQDFSTFLRVGGSILDAAKDIRSRIQTLRAALNALHRIGLAEASEPAEEDDFEMNTPDRVLEDEPVDSGNAQIQGANHVG